MSWVPAEPYDYLWRQVKVAPPSPQPSWEDQLRGVQSTTAGLVYLQLGPWPPWMHYVVTTLATNKRVTFYFLGPQLQLDSCSNCVWLPMNDTSLKARLTNRFGVHVRSINGHKLSDLKPMIGALLPELASRHKWFGYSDPDVLFGDLDSEVAALLDGDEMLVPKERFPLPLANGNFMLLRTSEKMLNAFRRNPDWKKVLQKTSLMVFDEWHVFHTRSIFTTYHDMLMAGELNGARPATRMFVQDAVITRGAPYPTIDQPRRHIPKANQSSANIIWRNGRLIASRAGYCHCPNDLVPQPGIASCPECLHAPGKLLQDTWLNRTVEVLGVHFQEWKKKWRISEQLQLRAHGGIRPPASRVVDPVPPCTSGANFDLYGRHGFRCMSGERHETAYENATDPFEV